MVMFLDNIRRIPCDDVRDMLEDEAVLVHVRVSKASVVLEEDFDEEMSKLSFKEKLAQRKSELRARQQAQTPLPEPEVKEAPIPDPLQAPSPFRSPFRRLKKKRVAPKGPSNFQLRDEDIVDTKDAPMAEAPLGVHNCEAVQQSFNGLFKAAREGEMPQHGARPQRQSLIRNDPPGIAVSIARSACLEDDMAVYNGNSMLGLYEIYCNSSVQALQSQHAIFNKACIIENQARAAAAAHCELKGRFSHLTLEHQQLEGKYKQLDLEHQSSLQQIQTLGGKLKQSQQHAVQLESSWQARYDQAREQSILDYHNSEEFKVAEKRRNKETIKSFKASSKGKEWVETRGLEYFTQGWTRCSSQIQKSTLYTSDICLDFLDMEKEMPEEYSVPPIVDEEDEDSEEEGGPSQPPSTEP